MAITRWQTTENAVSATFNGIDSQGKDSDWILRNTMLMHARPDAESSIRHKIKSQKLVKDPFNSRDHQSGESHTAKLHHKPCWYQRKQPLDATWLKRTGWPVLPGTQDGPSSTSSVQSHCECSTVSSTSIQTNVDVSILTGNLWTKLVRHNGQKLAQTAVFTHLQHRKEAK